jgi:hypothetical protein
MSLKSLFVKEEPAAKQKNTNTTQRIVPDQVHSATISISSINGPSQTTSLPNNSEVTAGKKNEYLKYFRDVMIKNNIPGPDYEEFVMALDKMKSQPMDEASKFKNVFITLESMGLTVPKLIEAAGFYKECFAKSKAQFDNDLLAHQNNEIVTRENKVKDLTAANAKIDAQMTELNKQKLANEATIGTINEEKQKMSSMLSSQSADFNAAYKDSVDEIDHNVELINKYLSATEATA